MESHLRFAICPFCLKGHDASTSVVHPDTKPADGDLSICFECCRVSIFDLSLPTKLRKPDFVELVDIASNIEVFNAIVALKAAKNGLESKGQGS